MFLMKRFPRVVLDEILGLEDDDELLIGRFFGGWARNDDDLSRPPVEMDEAEIIGWMRDDPQMRAERLAPFIPYFVVDAPSGELRWSPIAVALIETAPDLVPVVDALTHRFSIGSGSGPWSLRLVRRRPLLAALS